MTDNSLLKGHSVKLDILRGIAILMVFCYHASLVTFGHFDQFYHYNGVLLDLKSFPLIDRFLLATPATYGRHGVTLFLVISGYLIHKGTIQRQLDFKPVPFYNKRFWRIYPPYLMALVFFFISKGPNSLTDLGYHLVLLHNFDINSIYGINPSFWSLALEVQLYLIYPIYLLLYKKFGNHKSFIAILILSALVFLLQIGFKIESDILDKSVLKYWIVWVAGAWLAGIHGSGKRLFNVKKSTVIISIVVLIVLQFTIIDAIIGLYLFTAFFVVLIDWFLNSTIQVTNKLSRIFVAVGLCSYSLYLFHQPFIWEVMNVVRFGFFSFVIMAPLAFMFFFALSWLSYKYVELPSISIGASLYNKWKLKKQPVA